MAYGKPGRPRKILLPGAPVDNEPAGEQGTGHEIKDGDVFKHYAEKEHYVILMIGGGECNYAKVKSDDWASAFMRVPHEQLRKGQHTMSFDNAQGLVDSGKWKFVRNIQEQWV